MSTQPRSTVLIRPASLLDAELDLLEALRFAQGEPSLVIDATFEDDPHTDASKAKTKQVVAADQRLAMMREIRALSSLVGATPMVRPTIAPQVLPAPSDAVARESFITIPPAIGSIPPPISALPATLDASSPLDPTVRLRRVTPALAAAVTARSESSAIGLIWAVLISTLAVAFGWWLILGRALPSPSGTAKTAATVAGVSAAAPETSALSASIASPSLVSTVTPAPAAPASFPAGASSTPLVTGLANPSAIVRAPRPAHHGKGKSKPAGKSRSVSAPETDSSMESAPAN
jgi:hypothetical protein